MEAVADEHKVKRMTMFFAQFQVVPTEHNPQHALLQGAFAYCLVVEECEAAAYNRVRFYIAKDEWEITETKNFPLKVTQTDFEDRNIGLDQYQKAQQSGISIVYAGWARDGKTTAGPMPLEQARKFDLNAYAGKQKRLAQQGRCLHFESDNRCGAFINAHSIQKNGQLSTIANDGHVYTISRNIGTLKRNDGRIALEKHGIGKVSTFLGFCERHDNQLFSAIDAWPLHPTGEQVFLYTYRSVCRELFVKENALELFDSQLAALPATSSAREFFEDLKKGTSFGLKNLRRHKEALDDSLQAKRYADIEYVLFTSRQTPILAFSGLLFPEFDFLGRHVQNRADHRIRLDLLTICSAPVVDGWGFLFSWHKTSSPASTEFMRSLATVIHQKSSSGSDAMFRLVVSNCENLAVSPAWWEGLPPEQQAAVTTRLSHGANIFSPTDPAYLTRGLEGICRWEFETVRSS